jgi:hypothetical protein
MLLSGEFISDSPAFARALRLALAIAAALRGPPGKYPLLDSKTAIAVAN